MSLVTEKNDKAALLAQQVMHRISEDNLKPNPSVYAILYAHYTGMHPDISYQISLVEQEKKSLTTTLCEQLFDTYLSSNREKQFIDEATRKVQAVMQEISTLLSSAGVAHKEYNLNLLRQSDSLSSATDLNEVKKMISDLVDDTRRMVAENQKLEEKLQNSSHEMTKMRTDMQHLKEESVTDTLTNIPNRRAFDNALKAAAVEAMEKAKPLSLVMIDIDHFKIFNDTFGHQVGDQVLRLVARTLSEGLRPNELLSRYGGEEFAVIVPSSKLRDAEKLADKLRERIAAKDIINQSKNEKLGRLSISLGVSQLSPGESLSQFIDRADRALYKAKAAGRNRVVAIEFDRALHETRTENIVIDATS